jgi:hypothetical protein
VDQAVSSAVSIIVDASYKRSCGQFDDHFAGIEQILEQREPPSIGV